MLIREVFTFVHNLINLSNALTYRPFFCSSRCRRLWRQQSWWGGRKWWGWLRLQLACPWRYPWCPWCSFWWEDLVALVWRRRICQSCRFHCTGSHSPMSWWNLSCLSLFLGHCYHRCLQLPWDRCSSPRKSSRTSDYQLPGTSWRRWFQHKFDSLFFRVHLGRALTRGWG